MEQEVAYVYNMVNYDTVEEAQKDGAAYRHGVDMTYAEVYAADELLETVNRACGSFHELVLGFIWESA